MLKVITKAFAHVAEAGANKAVAKKLNVSSCVKHRVNEQTILERFKARLKSFVSMQNADEEASVVTCEYSKAEKLLEGIKSQMDCVEKLKHKDKDKERARVKRK